MGILSKPRQSRIRQALWQIHIYAGLFAGAVLAVVGLTGSLIVYLPELRRATIDGGTNVVPSGPPVPLDRALATVRTNRPKDRIASLYLDGGEAQALNFRTVSPEGDWIHTFVSQYTAGIVGQQNYEHAWLEWFFRLHADLLAGSTGRWLDGWFALVQGVLSISGIVLWWRGLRQWRRGFAYERRASWKRQVWDAHNLLGFAGSLFILLLSVTGAYFSFPATYRLVAARVTGTSAELPVLTVSAIAPDRWASLESFRAAAQQSIPDGEVTMINFPAKPDAPFSVRLKRSGDYHRIGYNYVVLESSTAVVLRMERFDQQPLGVQLMRLMTPLHYGTFGGTFTRILYIFVGFLPAILFGSGILMYWNRVLAKRWGSGANLHVSRKGTSASTATATSTLNGPIWTTPRWLLRAGRPGSALISTLPLVERTVGETRSQSASD